MIASRVTVTATRDEALLESLRMAARRRPGLSGLLALHRRVLKEQLAVRNSLQPPAPPSFPRIVERLAHGNPALELSELGMEKPELDGLCARLGSVLADYLPNFDPTDAARADWGAVAGRWYESRAGLTVRSDSDAEEVLTLIAGHGLVPFLELAASALLDSLERLGGRRGCCPTCGGEPDFCVLDESAERFLLCSRCCTLWLYDRVGCPFCDEANPLRLALFPVGEGPYRLYVCRSCHHYLKGIDLRVVGSRVSLPLERILTAGLDLAAVDLAHRMA